MAAITWDSPVSAVAGKRAERSLKAMSEKAGIETVGDLSLIHI